MEGHTHSIEQGYSSYFELGFLVKVTCVFIILTLIKVYFNGAVNKKRRDLSNQIIVITGANTGIGIETAKDLAKNGAKIILACRDEKRGKDATAVINQIRANSAEFMNLDLSDFSSIRLFANEFKSKFNKLDILINNAGVYSVPARQLTKDGLELQVGTNHFGHFLLTNLLLDRLKSSSQFRVINVSSLAHADGFIDFEDMHFKKREYGRTVAYAQSKLSNILFTIGLQKRIEQQKLNGIAVSLHPGVVSTEILRNWNGWLLVYQFFATPIFWLTFKNVKQGAQTTLYCAHEDFDKLSKGEYYSDCQVKQTQNSQINDQNVEKLWEVSINTVKL